MRSLRETAGRELEWIQPRATRRDFELKDGEATVARLSFRSLFGSYATAEVAEGSWTFKRVGFWQTYVSIRVAGSDAEIAGFRNSTWKFGGTLELPDGRKYRANTNAW